ncbi:MAG: PAS domain S-box protein [Lentisphaerae bacterium]|nr:PAS domain S-box protein [Lentisphaerota bacterium]
MQTPGTEAEGISGSARSLLMLIVAALLLLHLTVLYSGALAASVMSRMRLPLAELIVGLVVFWAAALTWLFVRRWRAAAVQMGRLEDVVCSISPDTLLVIDADRRIRRCNDSVRRLFGYEPAEVIGQRTDLLYADRRGDPTQPGEVRRAMDKQGFHVGTATGRSKDGATVPLEIITSLLTHRPGAVLVLRDISERISAEHEQRQVDARVRRHQRTESLGALAGRLAREFNAQLAEIRRHVVSATAEAGGENVTRALDRIGQAVAHADVLCRELQVYAGGGRSDFADLDLAATVLDIGRLLEVALPRRAVLKFDLPRGLPPVSGNRAQLHQVIMNLITNAGDALGENGGRIAVTAGVAFCAKEALAALNPGDEIAPGRYVFLRVADTGCGMDEATMARIFDPFFTTKSKGRGLGLASVAGIIRRHRGGCGSRAGRARAPLSRSFFPRREDFSRGRRRRLTPRRGARAARCWWPTTTSRCAWKRPSSLRTWVTPSWLRRAATPRWKSTAAAPRKLPPCCWTRPCPPAARARRSTGYAPRAPRA